MTSNAYFRRKSRELHNQNLEAIKSATTDQKLTFKSAAGMEQKLALKTPPRPTVMNTINENDNKPDNKNNKVEKFPPPVKNHKSLIRRGSVPVMKVHRDAKAGEITVEKDKINIVLFGAQKVGKTAIARKFLFDEFSEKYEPTGENSYTRTFNVFDKELTTTIVDTSGGVSSPEMRSLYITNGDGFIFVYAINDGRSFDYVKMVREEVNAIRGNTVPVVVVANKCDQEELREVSRVQAEMVAELDWKYRFIESSAKTGDVVQIFKELLIQSQIISDGDSKSNRFAIRRRSSTGKMNLNVLKGKTVNDGKLQITRTGSGNCKVQ